MSSTIYLPSLPSNPSMPTLLDMRHQYETFIQAAKSARRWLNGKLGDALIYENFDEFDKYSAELKRTLAQLVHARTVLAKIENLLVH